MNCKKITQLIPLFIETDLEAAEIQCVTAHLASCDLCSDAVKEFQSSQSLLHTFTAPEFNEAVFAQMRSSVLNEIARPQISNLSHPFWNWKTAFAASLATIIFLSGIAINRHSSNENYAAQASNLGEAKANNFSFSSTKNTINFLSVLKQIPKSRSGRNPITRGEASVSKRNPGNVNENYPSPERATEINDLIAASIAPSVANNQLANLSGVDSPDFMLPPASQAEKTTASAASNADKSASEPEMLRMEIQTADPNIKIIWLMPQTNTQADRK